MIPVIQGSAVRASLSGVLLWVLCGLLGCDVPVIERIGERQAGEAILLLRQAGLHVEKREARRSPGETTPHFSLRVPAGQETRALSILSHNGLLRPSQGAPPTRSTLLFLPAEQHAAQVAELSAALTETLERIPEVREARVHLALPEPDPQSPQSALRPTASVLLTLRSTLAMKTEAIAELVARAVPGLDTQDVAVLSTLASASVPTPTVPFSEIGPLRIAPESRGMVQFLLGALALLVVAVAWLAYTAWPRRRPEPAARSTDSLLSP